MSAHRLPGVTTGGRRLGAVGLTAALALGVAGVPSATVAGPDGSAGSPGAAGAGTRADLDVLYVGAHPDDEASRLSTFAEWRERFGVETGVLTVTRGEGGGNAVGPEEGPALGLIREREERTAVAEAQVRDVYNLDRADFYYSVSAPLHQEAWGQQRTLGQVVRVIRETRPEVVMTMTPAPSPGNHGGHQDAALLAIEAYDAAGDPSRYPAQLRRDGLRPFAPAKLMTTQALGATGAPGPNCPTTFTPANAAEDIYGVWSGRRSHDGRTYAQLERDAQRQYASQGWSGFPDVNADPGQLTCDYMTQIDARVPFTRGDLTAEAAGSSTMLEGAVLPTPGGLPLGTGLDLSTRAFDVVPGGASTLRVRLTAPRDQALRTVRLVPRLPEGWQGPERLGLGRVAAGTTESRSLTVTAPGDAEPGRVLIGLSARSDQGNGFTDSQLEVVPPVEGTQQLLPQVRTFQEWTARVGVEQLAGSVKPVLTLPSGGSRTVGVDVRNHDEVSHSGVVTLDLPAGFEADGPAPYADLAPGETDRVSVRVTNTDASLPTSNQGGLAGDYDYRVRTGSEAGTSTTQAGLELVPTRTLPDAGAPELDGTIEEGEYPARIDLSRRWEGTECSGPEDCSATGHLARSGADLYVAAEVTDDVLGTRLEPSDCKRHWRVDSLEIAIDPTGRSENTSTTFKAAVLPTTTAGVACAARDADNRQGPIGTFEQVGGGGDPALAPDATAPGFRAVTRLTEPYTGYVVETRIPMSALPDTVDPDRMGLNAFVYDSDTQDKTGQTRLGWSTWGGVQGDPYRWGRVVLEGAAPPQVPVSEPLLDFPALRSVASPLSIAQAVRTGVALSGLPETPRPATAWLADARRGGDAVRVSVRSRGSGEAHLFAMRGRHVLGSRVVDLEPGRRSVRVPLRGDTTAGAVTRVLMALDSDRLGTASSKAVLPRR